MNENIDLTKILKDCPKGTKFYSSIYGEVEVTIIPNDNNYPVRVFCPTITQGIITPLCKLSKDGKYDNKFNGECTLFPSKDQRDWSKFTAPWYKKEKASSQANERAWLYLVSDVLTWKDGIGQYLDDPRVQELAKKLCSEYTQKLYNPFEVKKENMEERTLKISFEKAKEFYQKGGEFRILALFAFTEEELTEVELPNTWWEYMNYWAKRKKGIRLSDMSEVELDKFEVDGSLIHAHNVLIQLHLLRDCYRQGWTPNDKCLKYSIEKDACKPYVSIGNGFLSFQSEELAKKFLNNFRDLIEKAGDLI